MHSRYNIYIYIYFWIYEKASLFFTGGRKKWLFPRIENTGRIAGGKTAVIEMVMSSLCLITFGPRCFLWVAIWVVGLFLFPSSVSFWRLLITRRDACSEDCLEPTQKQLDGHFLTFQTLRETHACRPTQPTEDRDSTRILEYVYDTQTQWRVHLLPGLAGLESVPVCTGQKSGTGCEDG